MSPGYWCRKSALVPYGCAPPAPDAAYRVQLLSGNEPSAWKPDVATPNRKPLGNLVSKPVAAWAGTVPPTMIVSRTTSKTHVHFRPTGSSASPTPPQVIQISPRFHLPGQPPRW